MPGVGLLWILAHGHVAEDSSCRLDLPVMDAWCESSTSCSLPCLRDAHGACLFAGKVQSWLDPCFYLTDTTCVFPCVSADDHDDDHGDDTPSWLQTSPPSPPPPTSAPRTCKPYADTPHLVEVYWAGKCPQYTTEQPCIDARYCEWK